MFADYSCSRLNDYSIMRLCAEQQIIKNVKRFFASFTALSRCDVFSIGRRTMQFPLAHATARATIKDGEREALAQQAKERFDYVELEARAGKLLSSTR